MKRVEKTTESFKNLPIRYYLIGKGLNRKVIKKFIKDFERYCHGEISKMVTFSTDEVSNFINEKFALELLNLINERDMTRVLLSYYLLHLKNKNKIAIEYNESKNWDNVISSLNKANDNLHESFIENVEETYQSYVNDGSQLKMITGITGLTLKQLDEIVINSKFSRYYRALICSINEGKGYKDLLKIMPHDFGLPETWSGCIGSDQKNTILLAISFFYSLPEFAAMGMFALPDIKIIARELEMPISILGDYYNK